MTFHQTLPSSAYMFTVLPCSMPGLTNSVASQAFSRRLLMKASTLRFEELTFSSPG